MKRTIASSLVALALGSLCIPALSHASSYEGANLPFTWQDATVYFVITDRFANGDPSNDHSYGRPSVDAAGTKAGTFHGGDIKGLTEKLDYIRSLGVNAIWVSSPVEQAHGWVGGGPLGKFQYYAYHGYYGLDFTSIDANMGTVDEFRNFVNEAHRRGIRVMIDVVMNHSGYSTLKDMCDFKFGKTKDGWDACKEWKPDASKGESFHDKPVDESEDPAWNRWWGKDWILFNGYGERCGADDGLDKCLAYLPDFKNTETNGPKVTIPIFLKEKWSKPDPKHDIPAALPYREGSMSVAQFQAHWLASWVEEFGIDGFRCDTVKYVANSTWKLLKDLSVEALDKWRAKNKGKDPAADWTDPFFMTGEVWGFTNDPNDESGYGRKGGFDSLIDFYFNSDGVNLNNCLVPDTDEWERYARDYGRAEGKPKLLNLTYISSHDTSLCRKNDMAKTGILFDLLSGDIQIYYGDETSRQNDKGGGVDLEQGMRSDMNFPVDINDASKWAANVGTLSTSFSSNRILSTWQKVGQFRLRNPAVGAGAQEKLDDGSYCRHFKDPSKGIDNSVVIHFGKASKVLTGKCFVEGTVLQDGFTGKTYTVSKGEVPVNVETVALLEVKR